MDLVVDLNYFLFLTLTRHTYLNKNSQALISFISVFGNWHEEYYSVHAYMVWSRKYPKSEISLDTGLPIARDIQPIKRQWTEDIIFFQSGLHVAIE